MGRHAAAGTMLTAAVAMLSAVDNTEAFVYSTLLSVNPKPWSSIRRTTASRQLPTFGLGSGARPLSQASCQRRVVKMDTGDDLEKLESVRVGYYFVLRQRAPKASFLFALLVGSEMFAGFVSSLGLLMKICLTVVSPPPSYAISLFSIHLKLDVVGSE